MSLVGRYLDPNFIEQLDQLQLSARGVVEGTTVGSHLNPVKGASVEFRQHRPYVAGDEPRRLDWRVLGRTNRPYVKEYDEESNLRCVLLLDCSGSMAYRSTALGGTKFDFAARLVAALGYLMLSRTESVGLSPFRQKIERWLAPRSGTGQLSRIIDVLERITPRGPSSPAAAMQDAANRLGRRALLILISDFFEPIERIANGLARLAHDRHELICLQVLHGDEITFPFRHWSRLRGLEGEGAQLCEPALVRKQYLENFRRHQAALHSACLAWHAEYHTLTTERPLPAQLFGYFDATQMMPRAYHTLNERARSRAVAQPSRL